MFSRRSFLAWVPAFFGGAAVVPRLAPGAEAAPTRRSLSGPEFKKTRLLERMAKTFQLLSDAQYAIADGDLDGAEGLLDDLSDAESFVTTSPCVSYRATDAEVARWIAGRAKDWADGS